MTDAEKLLWSKVRGKQLGDVQFYRQKIIGDYIVDFYCPKAKLVIEVDGAQHYEDDGAEKDRIRDDQMRALGQNVLRFSNREVLGDIAGVIEAVKESLPASLFQREEWFLPPPLAKGD